MDGLELLRWLGERAPDADVVMMTAFDDLPTVSTAMRDGAVDLLVKPLDLHELRQLVDRIFEDRRAWDAAEQPEPLTIDGPVRIVGHDPKMIEVFKHIGRAAATQATVLIRGESGTGKEVVARALFQLGNRCSRPFVKVNCAALPSELLESELFGFEKGAFTGAQKRKLGKFEYANQGTIFLDEISEMAPPLQAKLLQVLQDGEFSRLGGEMDVRVDARIIAATNRNLEEAVKTGEFREDLYYRLNVVTIQIPPLRDRIDAVPLLVEHFLRMYTERYNRSLEKLSDGTMKLLMKYDWPGNVRELENMIKRIVVLGSEQSVVQEINQRKTPSTATEEDDELDLAALGADFANGQDLDLKAISKRAAHIAEKKVIERVLTQTRWNRKEAAERLQISYKALLYKMKDNGLSEGR
jgi:two-component system response regulator AtoC